MIRIMKRMGGIKSINNATDVTRLMIRKENMMRGMLQVAVRKRRKPISTGKKRIDVREY